MTPNLFKDFELYIPTYLRSHRQNTVQELNIRHASNKPHMFNLILVVREEEADLYDHWSQYADILPISDVSNLAETRRWIIENATSRLVGVLDDDCRFYRRKDQESTKLAISHIGDHLKMFQWIKESLQEQDIAQAGVSAREGNNHIQDDYRENTRCMRCSFFDRDKLEKHDINYRVFPDPMDDFDITLQIINKGLKNRVSYEFAQNQGSSNETGGCESYRTVGYQARTARRLSALWPGYVSAVEKETKTAWGGGRRLDVRIQWKQLERFQDEEMGNWSDKEILEHFKEEEYKELWEIDEDEFRDEETEPDGIREESSGDNGGLGANEEEQASGDSIGDIN